MCVVISVQNVSKVYHLYQHPFHRVLGALAISRRQKAEFWALRNINLRVDKGEVFALLGPNGSGKSTLLQIISGILQPTSGRVHCSGRIAALLELGSGFHPELTGAENLVLNAALLGLSRRKTNQLFDRIVEFSGIGEFIGDPLRTYSSGMIMRLAFSVAIQCEPDILLIDEVLGVGDASFQEKSKEALVSFRRAGKSLLFVSHSPASVREMCDRALWIDHGSVMMDGSVKAVLEAYQGRAVAKQGL